MWLLRETPSLWTLNFLQFRREKGFLPPPPKAAGVIIPLISGEKEPRLHVCSPLHHKPSKKDGIWRHKWISRCPSFSQRAPSFSRALAAGGGCSRTTEANGEAGGQVGVSPCPIDSSFNIGLRRPGFRWPFTGSTSTTAPGRPAAPQAPGAGDDGPEGRPGTLSWSHSWLFSEVLTYLKRPWCWEKLMEGGEGDDKGWDGWMVSLTRWTWVWASFGSWWWTGKPGKLQSIGLQSQTRLSDWIELIPLFIYLFILSYRWRKECL